MLMTPETTPTTAWMTPLIPLITPDTYGSIACTAGSSEPVMNPMIADTTVPTTETMPCITGMSCWSSATMPATACWITGISCWITGPMAAAIWPMKSTICWMTGMRAASTCPDICVIMLMICAANGSNAAMASVNGGSRLVTIWLIAGMRPVSPLMSG